MTASASLSGCVYDVGLGFASDGYYDDGYGCDPYGRYDSYYDCDYGQGFGNIGFSGGWYENYYYPGYGVFLFDDVGRRYQMCEQYRRYWGEKRHNWYRERRGDDRDYMGYDVRERSYRDDDRRGDRRDGRRGRIGPWSGNGKGLGASAAVVPEPNPGVAQRKGRDKDEGLGRSNRGNAGGGNVAGYRQPLAHTTSSQAPAVIVQTPPPAPAERILQQTPRRQSIDTATERPQ